MIRWLLAFLIFSSQALADPGLSTFAAGSANSITVPNGLIGYWRMDAADVFGTKLIDRSILGNIGTIGAGLTTASFSAGKIRQAVSTGATTTAFVSVPGLTTALTGATNISAAVWVNPTSVVSLNYPGIIVNTNNINGFGLYLGAATAQIICGTFVSSAQDSVVGPTLTLNVWTFVSCTRNNSNITIYINGIFYATTVIAHPGAITPNVTTLIGCRPTPTCILINQDFVGQIDDVRVYNRVLSAAEVSELYTAGLSGHQ